MNIHTEKLTKRYGNNLALDGVDLDVREGEIFGLFGPNGAGKTTWIRVVTGMVEPTSGEATVCGINVKDNPEGIRENVAILVELPFLYEKMTLGQYLHFFADLSLMDRKIADERIRGVLDMMEMGGMWEKKLRTMSMGQRQRCEIARVMMSDARVLFLDEPFNGIDIGIRKKIRDYFRVWLTQGRSIVFTSHNLLESEHIVDRFAFIKGGKITAVGSAGDLKRKFLRPVFFLETPEALRLRDLLNGKPFVALVNLVPGGLHVGISSRDELPQMHRLIMENNIMVYEIRALGTIEDVFDQLNNAPVYPGMGMMYGMPPVMGAPMGPGMGMGMGMQDGGMQALDPALQMQLQMQMQMIGRQQAGMMQGSVKGPVTGIGQPDKDKADEKQETVGESR